MVGIYRSFFCLGLPNLQSAFVFFPGKGYNATTSKATHNRSYFLSFLMLRFPRDCCLQYFFTLSVRLCSQVTSSMPCVILIYCKLDTLLVACVFIILVVQRFHYLLSHNEGKLHYYLLKFELIPFLWSFAFAHFSSDQMWVRYSTAINPFLGLFHCWLSMQNRQKKQTGKCWLMVIQSSSSEASRNAMKIVDVTLRYFPSLFLFRIEMET